VTRVVPVSLVTIAFTVFRNPENADGATLKA
jgi:hypothetical protein